MCLVCCLDLVRVRPACHFPHWRASNFRCCEPILNRKNTTKSVPTKVLVWLCSKTKFTEGFSGPLWEIRSPEAPDRIAKHCRNGPWTHECCFEVVYLKVGSGFWKWNSYYYYCHYYWILFCCVLPFVECWFVFACFPSLMSISFLFGIFLFGDCCVATQLALQLHQERT